MGIARVAQIDAFGMFISWWLDYVRQNWRKEEGQTMG
jgi:hypothetical protein